jgi:hypothetical protein
VNVARVEKGDAYRILVRKPEEKGELENVGVVGRIILKWIFTK